MVSCRCIMQGHDTICVGRRVEMASLWTRRKLVTFGTAAVFGVFQRAQWRMPRLRARPGIATPGASPVATPGATPHAMMPTEAHRPASVAGEVTIALTDDGFRPSVVQSTNGHDLKVMLVNSGTRPHAFQIERLDIDITLKPGERRTLTIENPPLGDFTYTSDAPGDEHMEGMLIFYI